MKRNFNEQEIIRREKLKKLKDLGFDPYFSLWEKKISFNEIKNKYEKYSKEEILSKFSKDKYDISGRVMNIRNQGKSAFLLIKDSLETIQIYIRKDAISEIKWKVFELLDIGDIINVIGTPMKTKTNELSIRASDINILTKSLRPLPEKFHGLKDKEEIYRRRYLDLIMNDESKKVFIKRSKIIDSVRDTLNKKEFLEFETPILQNTVTGAAARPFLTHHNALNKEFSLRIATELPLKRLIVGGFEKVYELGRIFRNEGISIKHNPEFTSIEIYQAYSDLNGMIKLTEEIITNAALKVNGTLDVTYSGEKISLKRPFKRIDMIDLIKEITKVDFNKIKDFNEAKKIAKKHGIEIKDHYSSIGYLINAFFEEKCESHLKQPTFITGYPIEVSPLAKKRKNNNLITDRFELFILGREYANAFSELNDADDQYERFLSQLEENKRGNDETSDMDIDYVEALEYGMPPTGGVGIGIDRLVMLLTDSKSIRDVLLFPHQKDRDN